MRETDLPPEELDQLGGQAEAELEEARSCASRYTHHVKNPRYLDSQVAKVNSSSLEENRSKSKPKI